jgi:hypothetical protein
MLAYCIIVGIVEGFRPLDAGNDGLHFADLNGEGLPKLIAAVKVCKLSFHNKNVLQLETPRALKWCFSISQAVCEPKALLS